VTFLPKTNQIINSGVAQLVECRASNQKVTKYRRGKDILRHFSPWDKAHLTVVLAQSDERHANRATLRVKTDREHGKLVTLTSA